MVTVMSGITATTTWWGIASKSEETFHLVNWASLKWSTLYSGLQNQGLLVQGCCWCHNGCVVDGQIGGSWGKGGLTTGEGEGVGMGGGLGLGVGDGVPGGGGDATGLGLAGGDAPGLDGDATGLEPAGGGDAWHHTMTITDRPLTSFTLNSHLHPRI